MSIKEVMDFLEQHGSEQTKKILVKHGAKEPFFGVKAADLAKLQKKIKVDYKLSLELYNTGNSDAMYFAGLITDPDQFDKNTLNKWAKEAYWYYISDHTVPNVTSRTKYAFELALEWINSDSEFIESAGWTTLARFVSHSTPDSNQMEILQSHLKQAGESLHKAKNRVRYAMNGFIIACGSFEPSLNPAAREVAIQIGKVEVEMGGTACKVPLATEYIKKVTDMGKMGVKRKK